MRFVLILEDSHDGVRMQVAQDKSGVTDHPAQSLSAMWMARFYTELQVAHGKGHAYIQETEDGRDIALH